MIMQSHVAVVRVQDFLEEDEGEREYTSTLTSSPRLGLLSQAYARHPRYWAYPCRLHQRHSSLELK